MNLTKSKDNLCRIYLTPKGEKSFMTSQGPLDLRIAELNLISTCVDQMANESPKISEMRQRMIMVEDLENLSDTDNYLDFSVSDIELIKQTLEKLVGRRNPIWMRCGKLIDQLLDPKPCVKAENVSI